MELVVIIILSALGAIFGSFAGAQVWRLRASEFTKGELEPSEVSAKERKQLNALSKRPAAHDRSRCLVCAHQLAWYDLLPVASWLLLRGRCRYCQQSIGFTEFLLEIGLALAFAVSFVLWPFGLETFAGALLLGTWLVSLVLATVLLMYDLKWFILPDALNFSYAAVGVIFAITALSTGAADSLWSVIGSVGIMSGLYLVLYSISRGAWIGFGDVKLGFGLGLFLLEWKLALLALFLANLIGTLVIMPLLITKKITRKSIVPFGPFLIVGTFLAVLLGRQMIELYLSVLL